jgi:hypothetical protein
MKIKFRVWVYLTLVCYINLLKSQCVQSCSVYNLSSIVYTIYPNTGNYVYLGDDDTSAAIPIGFNFNYYCQNYNSVKVCSNGFITFSGLPFTTSLSPYAQQLPDPAQPNAVIAFNWNDLDPTAGGLITYTTIGNSPNQKFIVTYTNIPLWSFGGSNSGQIVLNEVDNSIEVHIGNAINNGWLTHSEGIENGNGSSGLSVSGRNLSLWTASNSAHKWQKQIIGTAPVSIFGNTMVCNGQVHTYSCTLMPGAISYSWSLPGGGWGFSGNSNVITATAGVSGLLSVSTSYTCGNSTTQTLSVTVLPQPLISILGVSPPVVCSGQSLTLSMSGSVLGYTVLPVNISSTSPLSFVPLGSAVYSVYGTSSNGCTTASPPTVNVQVLPSPTISVSSGSICLGQPFNLNPSGASSYTFSSPFAIVNPTFTGTYQYTVVGTGSSSCSSSAVSTLIVQPSPTIIAQASRSLICIKESCSVLAGGALSYTWSNGFVGNTQTLSPLSSTMYSVIGQNIFGCSHSASVVIQVQTCLQIQSQHVSQLHIYPQPAHQRIFLDIDTDAADVFTYSITDNTGKVLQTGVLAYKELQLNFLDQGVFQIHVYKNENQYLSGKILKL